MGHPAPPPAGVFGEPQPGANGNAMSIIDNHLDDDSKGRWVYRLRVLYNGETYSTTSSIGPENTVNNPIIINR